MLIIENITIYDRIYILDSKILCHNVSVFVIKHACGLVVVKKTNVGPTSKTSPRYCFLFTFSHPQVPMTIDLVKSTFPNFFLPTFYQAV